MKRIAAVLFAALAVITCREPSGPQVAPSHPLLSTTAGSSAEWTPIADLAMERGWTCGAAGADGRFYVAAGLNLSGSVLSAEVYDPATGTWSFIADPGAREECALVASESGPLYLLGGYDESWASTNAVSVYDPGANTWNAVASMRVPRASPAAAWAGGKLYVAGGYDQDTGENLTSAERHDPATDTWTDIASMSFPRQGPAPPPVPMARSMSSEALAR